jgi:pterin-4a-carbinolamine dehydratase
MAAHAWRTSLLKGSVRSGCFSGQRTCSLIPRQVGSAAQVQNTRTRIAQTCLIDATSTLSTVTSPSKFLAIASAKRCYSATSSSGSDDGGQRRTLPVVLNETEVKKRMLTLSGWWTQEGSVKTKDMTSGERVEKAVLQLYARYKFKRYSDGLGLVNAIGSVAERMNVRPTL